MQYGGGGSIEQVVVECLTVLGHNEKLILKWNDDEDDDDDVQKQ